MVLNDELRELITARAPVRQLKEARGANGTRFLREAAFAAVQQGRDHAAGDQPCHFCLRRRCSRPRVLVGLSPASVAVATLEGAPKRAACDQAHARVRPGRAAAGRGSPPSARCARSRRR